MIHLLVLISDTTIFFFFLAVDLHNGGNLSFNPFPYGFEQNLMPRYLK